MQTSFKRRSILPGFWPAFGYTVLYLSLIVLIPLSAVFLKSASIRLGAYLADRHLAQRDGCLSAEFRRVAGRPA